MSDTGFTRLKSRCWEGCILSGGSGGKSVPLPFPVSRSCLWSLAHDPASIFKASSVAFSSLAGTLTLLPPSYGDPCDYIGSTG